MSEPPGATNSPLRGSADALVGQRLLDHPQIPVVQEGWGPSIEFGVDVEAHALVVADDADSLLQVLHRVCRDVGIVGIEHRVIGHNNDVPVIYFHRNSNGHGVAVLAVRALENLHFEVSAALGGGSVAVDAIALEVEGFGRPPALGDVDIAPPVAPTKAGVIPIEDAVALTGTSAGSSMLEGQRGDGGRKKPPHGSVHGPGVSND